MIDDVIDKTPEAYIQPERNRTASPVRRSYLQETQNSEWGVEDFIDSGKHRILFRITERLPAVTMRTERTHEDLMMEWLEISDVAPGMLGFIDSYLCRKFKTMMSYGMHDELTGFDRCDRCGKHVHPLNSWQRFYCEECSKKDEEELVGS